MLTQLTELAVEKSSEKRLELMHIITDMFIENKAPNSPNELELFGDVFTKLLGQMDEKGKAEISNKFAPINNTPKTFAIALIYENAYIAAPMLEHSKVFDDIDLINASNLVTTNHRIAIAKRNNVSVAVTDTLIGYSETPVLRTVCDNESANISIKGFTHIVENHPRDGQLLAILLKREDVPRDIKKILPFLGGGILPKIARVANKNNKAEMQNLVNRTHKKREAEQKTDDLNIVSSLDEVNQIRAGKLDISEAVSLFASVNMLDELVQLLAEIEHLDASYVTRILTQKNGDELTNLCRSTQMNSSAFKQVCILREKILTLPLLAKTKMINQFKNLTVGKAKNFMRQIKLEHAVKQKQQ